MPISVRKKTENCKNHTIAHQHSDAVAAADKIAQDDKQLYTESASAHLNKALSRHAESNQLRKALSSLLLASLLFMAAVAGMHSGNNRRHH